MNSRRNIELKARYADLADAAARAMAMGARSAGELVQIDTYFHVPHGRLKLREIEGSGAELIWYDRPDAAEFRVSDYYVIPTADRQTKKQALTAALGVLGEVGKRRTLLLWHNVRIHLDHVENLGSFVEFEAVISDDADEAVSHDRLATLSVALGIVPADRVAVSYGDLLGI